MTRREVAMSIRFGSDRPRFVRARLDAREGRMTTSCRLVDGIVQLEYAGSVSSADLVRAALEALALARPTGCFLFLADLTRLAGGHSPSDLLGLVNILEGLGFPRSIREAVVLPPGSMAAADAQFYEDACQNRGWDVRLFPDRAAALAWLRAR